MARQAVLERISFWTTRTRGAQFWCSDQFDVFFFFNPFQERLAERYGKKPPKAAVEAENLLEKSELPKLADFYRALVDAYPGRVKPLTLFFRISES